MWLNGYVGTRESGQALVVVLLIMSVVLTIALSVVSRSVTDITVSRKEEDALRAISAAEAGAEKVLIAGAPTSCSTGACLANAGFSATVSNLGEGVKVYVLPTAISAGDVATIWFAAHDDSKNIVCDAAHPCFTGDRIRFCWGNSGTSASLSTTPAVEISVLYTSSTDASTAKIARAVFDPNSVRRNDNKFAAQDGACTIDSRNFAFSKDFLLSSLGVATRSLVTASPGPVWARIRMFYNTSQTHIAGIFADYSGNGVFPLQGTKIESTGTSGEANRKVVVYRPYADIPPVFDFALFSGASDLSK